MPGVFSFAKSSTGLFVSGIKYCTTVKHQTFRHALLALASQARPNQGCHMPQHPEVLFDSAVVGVVI